MIAPVSAIRKPTVAVFTLADYVTAGIMPDDQAEALRQAVTSRANPPGITQTARRFAAMNQKTVGKGKTLQQRIDERGKL